MSIYAPKFKKKPITKAELESEVIVLKTAIKQLQQAVLELNARLKAKSI